MAGTVHTQAFMMSFGNILVKTGVRPEVAGQVIAKLHALEAQAVAYPSNRAYPTPTPTMYKVTGQTRGTAAQGLVMLANIENRSFNLYNIYDANARELRQFEAIVGLLHNHLLEVGVKQVWHMNSPEFTKLTAFAYENEVPYKVAVEHYQWIMWPQLIHNTTVCRCHNKTKNSVSTETEFF